MFNIINLAYICPAGDKWYEQYIFFSNHIKLKSFSSAKIVQKQNKIDLVSHKMVR